MWWALDAQAMIYCRRGHVRDGDHAASMGKTPVRLMRRALTRQAAHCSTAPLPPRLPLVAVPEKRAMRVIYCGKLRTG